MNATINTMPETDNGSHQVPGMCYVPWQTFGKTYDPMRGLAAGTIFPELDKPFTGKCNMNMMRGRAAAMTRPSSQPMNRSELYRWVMALGFCAYDMLLYLDTHPDDAQALSYYNQCNELYNSAKKTYEERFEPLSAFGSQPLEDWDWNDGPMPWEGVK